MIFKRLAWATRPDTPSPPGFTTKSHDGALTAHSQALGWDWVPGLWEAFLRAMGPGDVARPQTRSSGASCGARWAPADTAEGERGAPGFQTPASAQQQGSRLRGVRKRGSP